MIVLSLVLVIVAAVLLVVGVFQEGTTLIYWSIGSCLAAMALLGIGVLVRRRSSTPSTAVSGYGPGSAGAVTPAPQRPSRPPTVPARGREEQAGEAVTAATRPAKKAVVKKAVVKKVSAEPVTTSRPPTAGPAISDATSAAPARKSATPARPTPARPAPAVHAVSSEGHGDAEAHRTQPVTAGERTTVAAAKKTTAKKTAAKKTTAKKTAAKKTAAKKTAAKKTAAKKTAAKKTAAKKTAAKKTAAK